MSQFIHLECASEYSIHKSIVRVPDLVARAQELNYSALALTDTNNLFAALKFYKACIKAEIKPIIGSVLPLEQAHIIALCMNKEGYVNLSKLISLSYQKTEIEHITTNELIMHHEGLILIHHEHSLLAEYIRENKIAQATQHIKHLESVFTHRTYIGIKRIQNPVSDAFLADSLPFAHEHGFPVVALGDVVIIHREQFPTLEAKTCIINGGFIDDEQRERSLTNAQYLTSEEEMTALFADIPEALANSVEIMKRCNYKFFLDFEEYFLPNFPTPNNIPLTTYFTSLVKHNLDEIIKRDGLDYAYYHERIEFELGYITKLNFTGYFLIVADFIQWAKDNKIPVGLGRGSGAGSLVAYALGITGIDPITYDLLFERFLNPERISMPDFDIDFSPQGRDRVIEYVSQKYGSEKVSQIITFGSMAARGVLRDTGRVLGMSYGFCDTLSKLLPGDLDISITKALDYEANLKKIANKEPDEESQWKKFNELKKSKELELSLAKAFAERYAKEEEVTSLVDLAKELEGLSRNVGTHAGGVIIAPENIAHFCPTYKGRGEDDPKVCQFDKKDVETIGLVKFDFLGLSNLDIIKRTVDIVRETTGKHIDINALDLTDSKVYEIYCAGDTTGIFQMESEGMRKHLKNLKPSNINDIIAMNALYRPGAMDQIDTYIDVKFNRKEIDAPHPILYEILAPTNGVFVYQEQVMRAAQKMSGFTLGGADVLRRAMGYKDQEQMAQQRQKFVDGAKAVNNIAEDKANEVFNYIDKFSGYGFNKSHSAAYAITSFQTAYLKAYYRAIFMSCVISAAANNTDEIARMVREQIMQYNMVVEPANINLSELHWTHTDERTLVYGLGSIKGVGSELVRQIVQERQNGTYTDLFDFCMRIPKKYLNRRALEALIYAGAFREFGQTKRTLIKNYPKALRNGEINQSSISSGQGMLFDTTAVKLEYDIYDEYSFSELVAQEKNVLGYYLTAHPVDEYVEDLETLGAKFPKDIIFDYDSSYASIASIEQIFYKETKKGVTADVLLSDGKCTIRTRMYSNILEQYRAKLIEGEIIYAKLRVLPANEQYKDAKTIVLEHFEHLNVLQSKFIKYVSITLRNADQSACSTLATILREHSAHTPTSHMLQASEQSPQGNIVALTYITENQLAGSAFLPKQYNVIVSEALEKAITHAFGEKSYRIEHKK